MSSNQPEPNESLDKKNKKEELDNTGDLENLPDELEDLPPQLKRVVEATLSMQRISATPYLSPLQEKINESHISKILEIVEKDDERTFADAQASRKYTLINTIVVLIFFGFITVFLVYKDVESYRELLKLAIAFAGGLGSGFGLKGYLDRKNK
ncbi:hypothetical protein PI95_009065 [Hassallia byssoidea VB512170]|uniref:DUF2335 domain-containing protein n=1 Tax=Hassallia byssoidea VB512170 TaxID=1304833 RepID=A0A846H517_9CYAN|nr:hypothetical protein [Hassalia byssoidea]NEU72717.1 hypothetical protein [Hassalia byssoidea VB512170]